MTTASESQQDLHEFLDSYAAEHPDDVLGVDSRLDGDQDICAIVWELARRGERPLVVCHDVEGVQGRVVTNLFASRERIASALGTTVGGLHAAFHDRATSPQPLNTLDAGPVTANVVSGEEVDLAELPMIGHFAGDRGPYFTSAIIIGEDPDGGRGNASYHRAMRHSRNQLATSLHSKGHLWRYLKRAADRGQRLPVAMVIGGHPLFMLGCAARVGIDIDERTIAGGLFQAGLEVVQTPRYGIGVPASADFVLEGYLDPNAHAPEGPFGEFSGYSSGRSTNDLLTVETVMRRADALLLDVVGGHSADHLTLSRLPRESEMVARIKERFPEVERLVYPSSGTHFHCYVSLNQPVPGYARQVILAMLGWDPYLKLVVTVDPDINVDDDSEVLWAVATRFQASRDLMVVDQLPGHLLDPSSARDGRTSRMGIDATMPEDFEGKPLVIDEDSVERARRLVASRHRTPSAS